MNLVVGADQALPAVTALHHTLIVSFGKRREQNIAVRRMELLQLEDPAMESPARQCGVDSAVELLPRTRNRARTSRIVVISLCL